MTRRVGLLHFAPLLLAGACGSKAGLPAESTASADGTSSGPDSDAGSTAASDPGTTAVSTDTGDPTPPGSSTDTHGWPTDLGGGAIVPCTEYEAVDPFGSNPYRRCMQGLAQFTTHESNNGDISYSGYAQFFEVFAESMIEWDEVIHDPHEGIDDCAARTYGNSGYGESEKVLWKDAGDLTAIGPDFEVLVEPYGDPVSVIGYDVNLDGYAPAWGQLHGITTTGATTPAYDLRDAIVLPERIELLSPTLTAATTVARNAVIFEWTPSTLEIPTWVALTFELGGGDTLAINCEMEDDGVFQIPEALLELAPLPATANVHLRRTDRRMMMQDEIHAIRMEGRTSRGGKLTIE